MRRGGRPRRDPVSVNADYDNAAAFRGTRRS